MVQWRASPAASCRETRRTPRTSRTRGPFPNHAHKEPESDHTA
ncbi:hypothetical protein HMPREF1550_00941 [Actinomyces sp. oral taxon 877 str. F0543]|nr:hypothetical protein HMPREF1550_00941 [Actinomyces sp. oral taxon 877 str. F0543]